MLLIFFIFFSVIVFLFQSSKRKIKKEKEKTTKEISLDKYYNQNVYQLYLPMFKYQSAWMVGQDNYDQQKSDDIKRFFYNTVNS